MKHTIAVVLTTSLVFTAVFAEEAPKPANPHAIPNPPLIKIPFAFPGPRMENTPVVYNNRPLLVQNVRP